jgi:hypothetical protein
MKQKIELDSYEKGIESEIHTFVPIKGAQRRKIETILEVTRKKKY